jgi:AAA domain
VANPDASAADVGYFSLPILLAVYSLRKSLARTGNIGKPLPDPYPQFHNNKVKFRYGGTAMLAGRPGSYKSAFALNLAVFWALQGLTGLYLSADSDEFTVSTRTAGIITGVPVEQVEREITHGLGQKYEAAWAELDAIRFVYEQSDMDGIATEVAAFEAVYGAYPDFIVVDNLIDFAERPDDWGGMLLLTKQLNGLARETKAHVCILHHAKREKDKDPSRPPADWEIQGKLTQIPQLVLTVGATRGQLIISPVKNRTGPQDPNGGMWLRFSVTDNLRIQEQAVSQ